MGAALLVQPDTSFIRDVIASGGGDLKKCYQCATCSVVCKLSPEDAPFPRKQMIEAQWGLKDTLVGDPVLWLCHNCGQCTTRCPRGARPGDVLGALRNQAIRHFAFPGAIGKIAANPNCWPFLFLAPVLIFAAIALYAGAPEANEPLEFANLFPIPVLEALFFAVAGFVLLSMAVGTRRFVSMLRASGNAGPILKGLKPAITLTLTHRRFAECGRKSARRWGHMLTMWGFVGLALMGTAVGIGTMFGITHTPLDLTSPWKIFANLCAVVVLAGTVILLADRLTDPAKRTASTWFDWFFLLTLTGVVVTGIASEVLRLSEAATAMYVVYFVHLVLIFVLFLYAPYSKFAHFLYRTVAVAAVSVGKKLEPVLTGGTPVMAEGAT